VDGAQVERPLRPAQRLSRRKSPGDTSLQESRTQVISDPVFLTAIYGDIVGTDVPASLLTEQSQRILTELAEVRGDVQSLSYRLSEQIGDVWARIVEATAELGVAGVQEAMSFVSYELLPA
jgi:hypothetical protein